MCMFLQNTTLLQTVTYVDMIIISIYSDILQQFLSHLPSHVYKDEMR